MSWSTILLLGDSITQKSFSIEGRWGSLIADRFQRIADVITRGFSGYNTRWCRILLPEILESVKTNNISCVTIFLGANDCSLPSSDQYVPLDEYQRNLEDMVAILEARNIERQKMIFITPPLYFQSDFAAKCLAEGKPVPLRSDDRPKLYALAMIESGRKLGVTVVDAYSAFFVDGRGDTLFCDGLHFSSSGADLLYSLVVNDIRSRVLTYRRESIASETMNYANWTDVDPKNLEESLRK